MIRPDPKPVRREKKKPAGLRAKRWGVRRKAGGTKHSRRWRNWGRMAWLHSLHVCFVCEFYRGKWNDPIPDAMVERLRDVSNGGEEVFHCAGAFQCAHMFGRYRDPHDDKTILVCRAHHMDIDQTRRWFLRLTKPERLWLRTFLAERATLGWEQLPIEERARWQEIGLARLGRTA